MADKKVKADDLVEITGTGNSKHLPSGYKTTVHKSVADKLVEAGHAEIGEAVASKKRGKKGGKDKLEM